MDEQMLSLADLLRRYEQNKSEHWQNDPQMRDRMISHARDNPPFPNYLNNPWRQPMVQGGIGIRSLLGLDPTEQQRLEDAFSQFPTRQYGRFPGR